jgi:RHS repeat-associated protein
LGSRSSRASCRSAPSGNGTTEYEYVEERLESATGAGANYEYTHDKIGNVLSEASAGVTTYFGYDRAGQMCWRGQTDGSNLSDTCGSGPAGSTNFSHDAAGNNTNFASNPTVYNDDSQVTTIDGVNMGYLDRGNDLRTTAGGVSYVNSPLGVTAKKEGTNITYYVRDTRGSILASYGASGTLFYFSEFNGSVAAIYNTGGTEVGSYQYSPYGKSTATGTAAENNPFRYIGGLQDKDSTGGDTYYKLGARYYDGQGHFTQPDPIIPGGGTYEYTTGDPVNESDPSGLKPYSPDGISGFGSAWDMAYNCVGVDYVQDVTCRSAVNGVVAGTAVTTFCVAGTFLPSFGAATVPCIGAGTVAGGLAAAGTGLVNAGVNALSDYFF